MPGRRHRRAGHCRRAGPAASATGSLSWSPQAHARCRRTTESGVPAGRRRDRLRYATARHGDRRVGHGGDERRPRRSRPPARRLAAAEQHVLTVGGPAGPSLPPTRSSAPSLPRRRSSPSSPTRWSSSGAADEHVAVRATEQHVGAVVAEQRGRCRRRRRPGRCRHRRRGSRAGAAAQLVVAVAGQDAVAVGGGRRVAVIEASCDHAGVVAVGRRLPSRSRSTRPSITTTSAPSRPLYGGAASRASGPRRRRRRSPASRPVSAAMPSPTVARRAGRR